MSKLTNRYKLNYTAIKIISKSMYKWMPELLDCDFTKEFESLLKDKHSEQGKVLNLIYDSVCAALDHKTTKNPNHANKQNDKI